MTNDLIFGHHDNIYEQLLGNLPDNILVLDERNIIRYANDQAEISLQRGTSKLVGQDFGVPVVADGVSNVEIVTNHGVVVGEMRASDLSIDGNKLTLVCLRDVTEAKELRDRFQGMLMSTISTLSRTLEVRDPYTAGHETRVAELCVKIAEKLGFDEDFRQGLFISAILHDIGKIAVPIEILTKPGRIETEEFDLIKIHPRVGYDILKNIDFPWPVAQAALQHHERIDGSGYPNGLIGAEIVQEARILAVADTVEAMMNDRPYRKGKGKEATLDLIAKSRGSALDSAACDACIELFNNDDFVFEAYS